MALHKHITEPDEYGYQLRIVRNRKNHGGYFPHSQWGGKTGSLKAAKSRRQQITALLGVSKLSKMFAHTGKTRNLPCGVCRTLDYDKRRDSFSVTYQVHYTSNGEVKNRKFRAGREDKVDSEMELHTELTAIKFRKDYEQHVDYGTHFNPDDYKHWRKERVYDNKY